MYNCMYASNSSIKNKAFINWTKGIKGSKFRIKKCEVYGQVFEGCPNWPWLRADSEVGNLSTLVSVCSSQSTTSIRYPFHGIISVLCAKVKNDLIYLWNENVPFFLDCGSESIYCLRWRSAKIWKEVGRKISPLFCFLLSSLFDTILASYLELWMMKFSQT